MEAVLPCLYYLIYVGLFTHSTVIKISGKTFHHLTDHLNLAGSRSHGVPSVYYDAMGIRRALLHDRDDVKGSAVKALTLGPLQTDEMLKDLLVSRNVHGAPFRLCRMLLEKEMRTT